MPTFYIKTFGCQMNEHDSQKMEAMLHLEGYAKARSSEEADLVVINTCSIREKSYQKAISEIGRNGARKRDRKPVVAVTGCVVSHDAPHLMKKFPFVDLVLGPDHESQLPRLLREAQGKDHRVMQIDFQDISDYEFPTSILWSDAGEKRVKAYVTIMKGCDNACSFCIVPFVRGKEVSRPSGEIIDEIQRLEGEGICEVTLLGQNVDSYGKRLPEEITFAKLLRRIDEETSIPRIRFTSPHPKDLSKDLMAEYGRNEKLCPHIHLPVQSGSNRVLKRMRRSYTREVYLRKVEQLRAIVSDIAITTDLIVGFPGETEKDFEESLSLMREVGFDASYSFVFSPRPRTEAVQLTDNVLLEVKKERLQQVQKLQSVLSLEKNKNRVGRKEEVLVEGPSRRGKGEWMGRTGQGRIVNFDGDGNLAGAILNIEIREATAACLKGVLC